MPSDRKGYVICTVARSGSTWLAELLASTGELGHPAEYFSPEFPRIAGTPGYPADRALQAAYVLRHGATPNGIYAFKMFPLDLDRVAQHLRWTEAFPGLRFVHLRRRDVLGQALSRVRAFQTRRWRSTMAGRTPTPYEGAAILEALRQTILQNARWEIFFARNGIEPLRLVYEDALAAADDTVGAIAELMELEARPVPDLRKIAVEIQRDGTTAAWRARFLSEFGDRDVLDRL